MTTPTPTPTPTPIAILFGPESLEELALVVADSFKRVGEADRDGIEGEDVIVIDIVVDADGGCEGFTPAFAVEVGGFS